MKYADLRHPVVSSAVIAALLTGIVAVAAPRGAWAQDPEPVVEETEATEPEPEAEVEVTPAIPDEPAEPATRRAPKVRGLSWTALTGGVPESGGIIHGEMGFSGLPRASYQHALGDGLSLGATLAFDFAGTRVEGFDASFIFGATARYGLLLPMDIDLGLRATVGARIPGASRSRSIGGLVVRASRTAAIVLDIDANVGWIVEHRFLVGGGITLPIELAFGGPGTTFNVPILVGAIAEYHVTAPMALTLDVKAGPHLSTADGIAFGLRAMLGIAYRI